MFLSTKPKKAKYNSPCRTNAKDGIEMLLVPDDATPQDVQFEGSPEVPPLGQMVTPAAGTPGWLRPQRVFWNIASRAW